MKYKNIILASQSPRRQRILNQLGLNPIIIPSTFEEKHSGESPREFAEKMAFHKAMEISEKNPDSLVIGADTVVVSQNKILMKPVSPENAFELLSSLSGDWHEVITGFSIQLKTSKLLITQSEVTRVHMKHLTPVEIQNYVDTGEPLDKAGAYGIQGRGSLFIDEIQGCFFNVMGLPVFAVSEALQKNGFDLWEYIKKT